jgi:methylmalonyl-CoA/ethylmalonyl-CoA epimerase
LTTPDFQIQKVSQVSICVHDLERAVAFYQEILGLKLLFKVSKMAFFDCGGLQIMLAVPENPVFDHPSSTFYFQVLNINEVYATLISCGVSFMGKPHKVTEMNKMETWMAFFHDPDDNVHAITCQVPVE